MRRIRVLIVDDSTVIRRLLTDSLSSDPEIEIVGTAPNGKIALAKLPQLTPDVVTLDIEMPEMDGLEATRMICAQWPKEQRPYIVAMTAHALEGDRERCLAAGMDEYIAKPVAFGDLSETIQRALQRSEEMQ